MISILLIAVSLAMDAFAVAVSSGIAAEHFDWRQGVRLGCWFGGFQFAMPLLGWWLGSRVSAYVQAIDHWVAFGLLAAIGVNMVWNALRGGEETVGAVLTARRLAVLATATSIDALAVGISLAFAGLELLPGSPPWANILLASGVIGVVAFGMSLAGGLLGRRLGSLFQRRAELAGGLVLIAIGGKILVEHLL